MSEQLYQSVNQVKVLGLHFFCNCFAYVTASDMAFFVCKRHCLQSAALCLQVWDERSPSHRSRAGFGIHVEVTQSAVYAYRYGMREALAIVAEQGLDSMWRRHTQLGKYLWEGLNEIGLEPYVTDLNDRLITVNTIRVPEGIDGPQLTKFAMDKFSLEISAGMGLQHHLMGLQQLDACCP